ncbi:DegT/DnrJ/EryC1/StrS family aminotransferase, partial [Mycobacterium tuberculosis]|nr:DegT/DnrJ/EryC1/StrS family aminotransferase [Mycobacterium tuberculosis]MBZ4230485.1 DegT/DnrJ/EryC1/StrS family aminotransferase [Mycobacterium tuberculosis]MBZ4358018.1 DegT/DnrJ/EryC1/StrS family aminotransferase [Mycobacterium tuberculosis]
RSTPETSRRLRSQIRESPDSPGRFTMASYRGRALGSIGDLGALSFHETKNVISGEGGALLVNS